MEDNDYRMSSLLESYEALKFQCEALKRELQTMYELIVWYDSIRKLRRPVHAEGCECTYCVAYRKVSYIIARIA